MVALGDLNSRMKDFFDIWLLCRQFEFDLERLAAAIAATFQRRETVLPERPFFTDRFTTDKQRQWQAFVTRLGEGVPTEPDFGTVLEVLEKFLGEPVNYLTGSDTGTAIWTGERWRTAENHVE